MRRVALVLASSPGGIGRHVVSLARGLVAGGDEVTVFGPRQTQERFDFTRRGAAFAPLDTASAGGTLALRKGLAVLPPDIVHAHGPRARLAAGVAAPPGVPLVVTWANGLAPPGG